MMQDITIEDFLNKLFKYIQIPLEQRGWIRAKQKNEPYPYDWEDIEEFINKWLKKKQPNIDRAVNKALVVLDDMVDNWYLLNFKLKGGRSGDEFEAYAIYDREDFELHTKVREFIFLRAEKIKKEEEAKQREAEVKQDGQKINKQGKKFEDYLTGIDEENKEQLMGTIKNLLSKNSHQTSFFVVMALQQAGYINQGEKFEDGFYEALNISFNTKFYSQVFSQYFEKSKKDKNRDLYIKEIEQLKLELTQ